ncbi:MAG: tetratricopeptide repeat protein [Bacteroidales bacterium]|nr:tetratricopeptide repeat protein [Bacteroidales bacterium]MBD5177274.1 tetratricopeptide repeat protein [Bacteroidales bacterium]
MKIKLLLSLILAGSLAVSAQTQGYKDGIEYYKAGQLGNAKTILDRTVNDASTDKSLANYYLGQVALEQNDKAAAKAYFEKGIAMDANNAYNYVGMGALDLLNGNADAAADNFKKATGLAKKNAEISVSIARAYYNADPVKYAKDITKNLEKARKDSKNQASAIYVFEGDMLMDQQDYGTAAGRYENAIYNDKNSAEGYVKYANAYFFVNPQFAIQRLEEYLKEHPESAMIQRELAEKYFKANYWRKASDLYGTYIQNPNHFPEDKARYSVLLYWGEKYPESLQIAEEILATEPSNFQAQRMVFLDLAKMGKNQEAVEAAEKFFKANPDADFTTNDYVTYAEALNAIDRDEEAIKTYELAAEKDPQNGDLLKNLSTFYSQNKQYAKSAEAYDAYLKLQENPTLTDLFGMSGRYLNAALNVPDSVQALDLANRGLDYIGQVIERGEPQPAFFQRQGRLHIASNNKMPNAAAIEAYDKMLEMLDADPANMAADNKDGLNLYKEAYSFEILYYGNVAKDAEKTKEFTEKYNVIKDLLTPQ